MEIDDYDFLFLQEIPTKIVSKGKTYQYKFYFLDSQITKNFFATVQNKMHCADHGKQQELFFEQSSRKNRYYRAALKEQDKVYDELQKAGLDKEYHHNHLFIVIDFPDTYKLTIL